MLIVHHEQTVCTLEFKSLVRFCQLTGQINNLNLEASGFHRNYLIGYTFNLRQGLFRGSTSYFARSKVLISNLAFVYFETNMHVSFRKNCVSLSRCVCVCARVRVRMFVCVCV